MTRKYPKNEAISCPLHTSVFLRVYYCTKFLVCSLPFVWRYGGQTFTSPCCRSIKKDQGSGSGGPRDVSTSRCRVQQPYLVLAFAHVLLLTVRVRILKNFYIKGGLMASQHHKILKVNTKKVFHSSFCCRRDTRYK